MRPTEIDKKRLIIGRKVMRPSLEGVEKTRIKIREILCEIRLNRSINAGVREGYSMAIEILYEYQRYNKFFDWRDKMVIFKERYPPTYSTGSNLPLSRADQKQLDFQNDAIEKIGKLRTTQGRAIAFMAIDYLDGLCTDGVLLGVPILD